MAGKISYNRRLVRDSLIKSAISNSVKDKTFK